MCDPDGHALAAGPIQATSLSLPSIVLSFAASAVISGSFLQLRRVPFLSG